MQLILQGLLLAKTGSPHNSIGKEFAAYDLKNVQASSFHPSDWVALALKRMQRVQQVDSPSQLQRPYRGNKEEPNRFQVVKEGQITHRLTHDPSQKDGTSPLYFGAQVYSSPHRQSASS